MNTDKKLARAFAETVAQARGRKPEHYIVVVVERDPSRKAETMNAKLKNVPNVFCAIEGCMKYAIINCLKCNKGFCKKHINKEISYCSPCILVVVQTKPNVLTGDLEMASGMKSKKEVREMLGVVQENYWQREAEEDKNKEPGKTDALKTAFDVLAWVLGRKGVPHNLRGRSLSAEWKK